MIIRDHSAQFHPPNWRRYERLRWHGEHLGYFAPVAVVNRFHARYRLARAFRGMELEGYSLSTKIGYDSLTKVSLHWSAFEGLQKALLIAGAQVPALAARHNFDHCLCVAARVKVVVASFMQPAAVFLKLPHGSERSSHVRG